MPKTEINSTEINPIKKPHYLGHRKRTKEKFLKSDSKNFSDYELIEILLFFTHPRIDTKIIAKELLKKFNNVNELINCDNSILKETKQINDSTLTLIKTIKEIIHRSFLQKIDNKPLIDNWNSLLSYCQIKLGNLRSEEFRVLFLNKKHTLIEDHLLQQGSADHIQINIDTIIKKAILLSASYVILTHNHPSGNSTPSKNDINTTNKIAQSLNIINIKTYDHIIIGNNEYYSFKENSLI